MLKREVCKNYSLWLRKKKLYEAKQDIHRELNLKSPHTHTQNLLEIQDQSTPFQNLFILFSRSNKKNFVQSLNFLGIKKHELRIIL